MAQYKQAAGDIREYIAHMLLLFQPPLIPASAKTDCRRAGLGQNSSMMNQSKRIVRKIALHGKSPLTIGGVYLSKVPSMVSCNHFSAAS